MLIDDKTYLELVDEIKRKIAEAQREVVFSANKELITLYWNIGKIINEKNTWGSRFIENLSRDINLEFPKMAGFSRSNLFNMSKFAKTYPDFEIVQRALYKLPWRSNLALMEKVKDKNEREWYIAKAIENKWSQPVLIHHIENGLYQRQVSAIKTDNFTNTLPPVKSDLVRSVTKDPYIFDFVSGANELYEIQTEKALVDDIARFLLELGSGFAFLGNQYHLEVGGEDFYIDLLFYNIELRCFVVIELKTTEFKPEFAGKLNFYLSAVDSILKKETDNPTIGLLLCKKKNSIVAEYALRDMMKPMGVAEYRLTGKLPEELENILPSANDIEARIRLE